MFPLALLCLLLSSCHQDRDEMYHPNISVESRTTKPIKVKLLLEDGTTYQNDVIRANCSALSSSSMSVKLILSVTDSITITCKNLLLEEVNNKLHLKTLAPNFVYSNKSTCFAVPYTSTAVKMTVQSGNITVFPNGFIGEEEDGI